VEVLSRQKVMIDTSLSSVSAYSLSTRERQLSVANDALVRSNQQLQGENRDLRAAQRTLEAENDALQSDINELERLVSRTSTQATEAGSSGTLLDVYA